MPQVEGEERLSGDPAVAERLASIFRVSEADHQVSISGIHGLHPYPGRMHPMWARRILEATREKSVIMDPFCGGGTVAIEARRMGHDALASDINPIALRLARLRTHAGPDLELLRQHAERCAEKCTKRRTTPFSELASGEKRLPRHVLAGLISLRDEIEHVDHPHIREVLLFAMSPLIDKFSSRADRPAPRVPKDAVPRHFLERVTRWADAYRDMPDVPNSHVERADARWLPWRPGSVDIVITSPPYPGVLDYVEAQSRRLRWLGRDASARGASRKEIGKRSGNDDWAESMRPAFQQISRSTHPESLVYMVVGDGVSRGRPVFTDRALQTVTRQLPLKFVASVTQLRPHFHQQTSHAFARRPRGEHLILWRRTGTKQTGNGNRSTKHGRIKKHR